MHATSEQGRARTAFLLQPGTRRDECDARDRRFRPRVANAIAGALRLSANRDGTSIPPPSRLFLYYNARASLDEAGHDCGTTVRAAIKAAAPFGAPPEPLWRYRTENAKPLGGHALLAVGYDVKKKAVLARNSLGARFGKNGFFWIDERYFTDGKLSFDFWSIRSVAPS